MHHCSCPQEMYGVMGRQTYRCTKEAGFISSLAEFHELTWLCKKGKSRVSYMLKAGREFLCRDTKVENDIVGEKNYEKFVDVRTYILS